MQGNIPVLLETERSWHVLEESGLAPKGKTETIRKLKGEKKKKVRGKTGLRSRNLKRPNGRHMNSDWILDLKEKMKKAV